jgi:hypothetical protein
MSKKRPYYFEWRDHWSGTEGGWIEADHYTVEPLICRSLGWIVKEDKHGIFIAANFSPSSMSQVTYLLKSCIVKKRRIPL